MPTDLHTSKPAYDGKLLERLALRSRAEKNVLDFRETFKEHFRKAFNEYVERDRSASEVLGDIRSKNDIFYHWSKVAENLYAEIDIRPTIVVRDNKGVLEVGVDEQQILNVATRIYAIPPADQSNRKTMFYRPEIGSPMFNLFFDSFLSSLRLSFSKIIAEIGYSSSELFKIIESETLRAPLFREVRGKLSYIQGDIRTEELAERKSLVSERWAALEKFAQQRVNEQPQLKLLVEQYGDALKRLRKNKGALRLFVAGMEIESLVRIKASATTDAERNAPFDADLLFVIRSLMIAHATLVSLFSEIEELAHELDRYSEQLTTIEALGDRIFDPILDKFGKESGIFDQSTLEMTAAIRRLDDQEKKMGLVPTRQSVSAKHGWVRAALGAVARVALRNVTEVVRIIRDATIKEVVSEAVKHPATLTASVAAFLIAAQPILLNIADRLSATFGWIRSLLAIIGLD